MVGCEVGGEVGGERAAEGGAQVADGDQDEQQAKDGLHTRREYHGS
jgi:hypothetical protein